MPKAGPDEEVVTTDMWAICGLLLVVSGAFRFIEALRLQWLSVPLLALLMTALLANVGALPSPSETVVYDFLGGYGLQAAIFLLLLQVSVSVIRRTGPGMGAYFLLGAAGIWAGLLLTLAIPWIRFTLGGNYPTFAGVYAATYTGGSVNFNAAAAIMGLEREGAAYAVAIAVDNFMGVLWLAASVAAAKILQRLWPQTRDKPAGRDDAQEPSPSASPADLALAATATAIALLASDWLNRHWPLVHPILWLSTLSLLAAQLPPLSRLAIKIEPFAVLLLYLFVAAIGAQVSYVSIISHGASAFAALLMVAIAFAVHGLLLFLVARRRRADTDLVLVASQAAIGGPPTALALAEAVGRPDLRIPGVAAGLFGYAIGTYAGLAMAATVAALT